jgi:TolB-like protein/tetratricopeptide (TPR) repeat protein
VVAALGLGVWTWYGRSSPAIESLAVLPFQNLGQDPETEYLGDGVTESLIAHLSRVPSLKVMARGTVIRFKGVGDPQQAARTLGVGAVVTGTVARRNDRVVISAELIDSSTGERLWGQTYDRPFTDLLRVQDSIVSEISDGLRLHLTGQEKQRLGGFGTENVAAYELYLKARFLMANDTEEDDLEARKLLMQAVALDPNFLEAHVDIAATYARANGNGYAPPRESLAQALVHIQKALAIDPNNVVVRAAAASNRFQTTWDWSAAERDYRVLSQEPALMTSVQYHPFALFYVAAGRPDEAVDVMERALVLDPGNSESRVMLGNFLVQAGRLDDALKVYNSIATEDPKDPRPLFGAADVYKRRGDIKSAIDSRRKAYELAGDEGAARALAGAMTEADYQKAEVAVARMRLQELTELAKERYISPLDLARLHALVGDREQALAGLEKAMTGREIGLMLLKADQAWDSIRSDPRFAAIVRRVGIP